MTEADAAVGLVDSWSEVTADLKNLRDIFSAFFCKVPCFLVYDLILFLETQASTETETMSLVP